MQKELEEIEALTKERARMIVESGQEHAPIMVLLTPAGPIPVLLKSVDKDRFKEHITQLLRNFQTSGYVFINEAWVATCSDDSLTLRRVMVEGIPVSELPLDDRSEELTILTVEKRRSAKMLTARIDNPPSGRRLGEWKELNGGKLEGRMVVLDW